MHVNLTRHAARHCCVKVAARLADLLPVCACCGVLLPAGAVGPELGGALAAGGGLDVRPVAA
jgi:hypothetical protein